MAKTRTPLMGIGITKPTKKDILAREKTLMFHNPVELGARVTLMLAFITFDRAVSPLPWRGLSQSWGENQDCLA